MATYILGPVSDGGRDLARALQARKVTRLPTLRRGDVVINWGVGAVNVPQGVTVINNAPVRNKYQDALILQRAGVPTITVSRTAPAAGTRPTPTAAPDPARPHWNDFMEELEDARSLTFGRGAVIIQGLTDLEATTQRLRAALRAPAPTAPRNLQRVETNVEWIGRRNNHTGGLDLLNPTRHPDYWVRRERFEREVRIHSFDQRSIRAGVKRHREGFPNPHQWIRSYDGGWRIVYDGVSARQATRDIAHRACRALGLDFGAVDIGVRADRSLCVLEVNRRPGLEGGSIEAYVRAINRRLGR